jgi:sulfite exporter TauE/SafE
MITALAQGFGLGIATGVSCLASCGPIYLSYLLGEKRSGRQSLATIVLLNLGRFVSYAGFGALMGLLGGSLPSSIRIPVAYGGYILLPVFLISSVIRTHKSCGGGCAIPRWLKFTRSPILLGMLTGFSLCPAFLIAVTGAFSSTGPLHGALLFTGFFAGTTVYLVPFAAFGLLSGRKWVNTVARYAAVFVAVYFGILGIRGMASYLFPPEQVLIDTTQPEGGTIIYSAMEQDTLYILHFPGFAADRGADMHRILEGSPGPEFVLVTASETGWRTEMDRIPPLSGVLGPWWMDHRSGAPLEQWQMEVNTLASDRGLRVFAIEYEPFDTERAGIVYQYLGRYSFRCGSGSGFTFLITADAGCSTFDCSACPALGNY